MADQVTSRFAEPISKELSDFFSKAADYQSMASSKYSLTNRVVNPVRSRLAHMTQTSSSVS